LSGRVAIVTGASGGIGRATALEFAHEGADVVLQYMSNAAAARTVADKIAGTNRKAITVQVDFSDVKKAPDQVRDMVDQTIRAFGKVDILLNLAGYPAKGEWNKRFIELTPEDFFKPINVDLFGSFLCSRAVAPHFLKQKRGVIVNLSSTPALGGHDKGFAFTVAKAGVIGLTKALAFELAPFVRVNTIALGNIETDWVAELSAEDLARERGDNLIGRFGTPEEVAKTLVFLCSDNSSFLNGQTIALDGGSLLH
jgi:3-oxoacyl-[acyl-carrier protein] reductase